MFHNVKWMWDFNLSYYLEFKFQIPVTEKQMYETENISYELLVKG